MGESLEPPAVRAYWEANFGVAEVSASFDRVRSTLVAELGDISSVDLQLLRLENRSRIPTDEVMKQEAAKAGQMISNFHSAGATKQRARNGRRHSEIVVASLMHNSKLHTRLLGLLGSVGLYCKC